MPLDLQPDQYEQTVKASPVPVLLDFWGPQCGPCIALNPTVKEIEESYKGRLRVVKVNAPDHRQVCRQLKVLGLPTFIVVRDGQEVARISRNVIGAEELTRWVKEKVGP